MTAAMAARTRATTAMRRRTRGHDSSLGIGSGPIGSTVNLGVATHED